jgi:hypothetical protein
MTSPSPDLDPADWPAAFDATEVYLRKWSDSVVKIVLPDKRQSPARGIPEGCRRRGVFVVAVAV